MKMPKNLSLSKPKTGSLSNRSMDWSGKTNMRSSSGLIAALVDSGPKVPEIRRTSKKQRYKPDGTPHDVPQTEVEAILLRIKREQNRLDKAMAKGMSCTALETQEDRDRAAYVLRKNQIINNLTTKLVMINRAKQKIDAREFNKSINKQLVNDGQVVKLEKNYVVAASPQLAKHRNAEYAGLPRMTQRKEFEIVKLEKSRTDAKLKLNRQTMADLVRAVAIEKREEKHFPDAIQAEIDKVFVFNQMADDFGDDD